MNKSIVNVKEILFAKSRSPLRVITLCKNLGEEKRE